MSVKERMMTIRLCEKIAKHPQFAKSLGIELSQENMMNKDEEEPP